MGNKQIENMFDFRPWCSECRGCCKLRDQYFVFVSDEENKTFKKKGYSNFQENGIINKKKNGDCMFLGEDGCTIPSLKPLDCYCYPITPLWEEADGFLEINFLLDLDCPASLHLSREWIIATMKHIRQITTPWTQAEKKQYTRILEAFIFNKKMMIKTFLTS